MVFTIASFVPFKSIVLPICSLLVLHGECKVLTKEEMRMLHLAGILLTLNGVFTQKGWSVIYPNKSICAVRGFSVSLPCTYFYPQSTQVVRKLWCSMNSNTEYCINPSYVYDSTSHTDSDFQFAGDNTKNCTLLIHDLKFNYSGEYQFRFITNLDKGKFTGHPGVTLQVTDLKLSLIRLSGKGTIKQGDSLNLTCDVNCTHTSSQFMWSKNNQSLNKSGPVLHFPNLTTEDSGKYTCTWDTKRLSGSKSISFQVEAEHPLLMSHWIAITTAGVIFITLVIFGSLIYYRRRKFKASEENKRETGEEMKTEPQLISQVSQVADEEMLKEEKVTDTSSRRTAATEVSQVAAQLNPDPQSIEEEVEKGEVIYAPMCFKSKKPTKQRVCAEQDLENDSIIYSTLKTA